MKNLIIGFILGAIFFTSLSYAYRMGKPDRITEYNEQGLVILNTALEQLWNITNGRYNLNVLTSNPDGTVKSEKGDMVIYDAGATEYLEINTDGSTTWRGVLLTNTP